jgi:phage antirepressor YoqD-like protein
MVLAADLRDGDFREVDGEWRIRDVALGRNLGFSVDVNIRKLIRAHEKKLSKYGIVSKLEIIQAGAGRPGFEYWLTQEQAFEICHHSDAPRAEAVSIAVNRAIAKIARGELTLAPAEPELPKSLPEALRKYADALEQKAAAEAEIAVLAPKAEIADRIAGTEGLHTLSAVGKTLGFGLVTFCERLRRDRILMEKNLPYETHRKAGRFEVKQRPYWCSKHKENRYSETTFVTGKGVVWLAQRFNRPISEVMRDLGAESAESAEALPLFDRKKVGSR